MSNQGFEDHELFPASDVGALDSVVSVSWESRGPVRPDRPARPSGRVGKGATPTREPAQLELSLAVTTAPDGGARASLVARGEIDVASVRQLHAAALAVASAAHPRPDKPVTLTLDWEHVRFLDSSGVHLLQDIHAAGVERGWAVELIPPTAPAPARLLQFAADRGWFPRVLVC